MTNSLTSYSRKEEIATSYKAFKAFIDTFGKINPNISETDILMIKECISDDQVTVEELQYGVKQAYKDPERYGKVEWNHVWKWILKFREHKPFNPENAKRFQNAFK